MESGRGKLTEENSDDKQELSSDLIKSLIENIDGDFFKSVFLPNALVKETLFTPFNIVALYMAYINNKTERKLLAPYFLKALNNCTAHEVAALVQGTRPVNSETYRAIEKIGKTSKSIEAYICYAFVTADINELKIEELNGVMNYLRAHHADKTHIFNSLKATLTALALARENKGINLISWPPSDITKSNLSEICLPFNAPPYYSSDISLADYNDSLNFIKFRVSPPHTQKQFDFGDLNVTGFFYCNFSSLKISLICFDSLPQIVNFENADLSTCKLIVNEMGVLSDDSARIFDATQSLNDVLKNPINLHFLNSKLADVNFELRTTNINCIINLLGCHLSDFDFLNLFRSTSDSSILRMNQTLVMRSYNLKMVIDHATLQSPELIRFLAAAESMLTQPHQDEADPINFFYIQLPSDITSKRTLVQALNKYSDAENARATPEGQLANNPIRIMLLAAVVNKLEDLANAGVDIKPLYDAAFKHPCFSTPNKSNGFFKTELTDSQKMLMISFNKMVADIEGKKTIESSSEKSPKK